MSARTVIIGAGHAGLAIAARLRALSADAGITIVSAEQQMPYQRPPLSKAFLSGKLGFDEILIKPESWYLENRIDLIRGVAALSIDRPGKALRLADGGRLAFEHLVLALGSSARRLPAEAGGCLPGVMTMRDLNDAQLLKKEMLAGKRLVVIGGGYIGLEAASEASKLGLNVTVLEAAGRILQRVAARETSDFIRALHQSHGVVILENTKIEGIVENGGKASGVLLEGGKIIPADFVLTGIGVIPATELAETAGLEISNGIAVNERLQTLDPAIFAAGDCASFVFRGERVRLESVQNANDQGCCVAANIVGEAKSFVAAPWFWSDQFDLKLQIAGLNMGYDSVVTRQGTHPNCRAHFYFNGSDFLSVDCMNDPLTFALSRKLLEAGKALTPAQAGDSAFSLKSLLS